MREAFRRTLEGYQQVAREQAVPGIGLERAEHLNAAAAWEMEKAERASRVPGAVQRAVFLLQQEKAGIMQELKEDFRQIEVGAFTKEKLPHALETSYRDGKLVARWMGLEIPVTVGTIIADLDWDKHYDLDVSVPKNIRKRYLLELAKQRIFRITEKQIAIHESANPDIKKNLRMGIGNMPGHERSTELGHLAERMIYGLMRRLEIDADPGFRVMRADNYHDVVQKIDFLLSVPSWLRGVRTEVTEDDDRMVQGFQLTTSANSSVLSKKRQEVKAARASIEGRLRDVSLIRFNGEYIAQAYARWRHLGRPPGGPYAYIPSEGIREIVYGLLKEIVPREVIDAIHDSALRTVTDLSSLVEGANAPPLPLPPAPVEKPQPVDIQKLKRVVKEKPLPANPKAVEGADDRAHREAFFEAFQARESALRECLSGVDPAALLRVHDPKELIRLAEGLDAAMDSLEELSSMRKDVLRLNDKRKQYYLDAFRMIEGRIVFTERRAYAVRALGHVLAQARQELFEDPGAYLDLLGIRPNDPIARDWQRIRAMHEVGVQDPAIVKRYKQNVKSFFADAFNDVLSKMNGRTDLVLSRFRRAAGCILMDEMLEHLQRDRMGVF